MSKVSKTDSFTTEANVVRIIITHAATHQIPGINAQAPAAVSHISKKDSFCISSHLSLFVLAILDHS
ncbi:hypothetical protein KKG31_00850 [Patescibacteria group bacterium]|nr:hypothetical protein [Patescibacteria group bacterium]